VFILSVRHGVLQNSSDPWDAPVLVFGFGSLGVALVVGAFSNYAYGKHFATTTIALLAPLLTISVLLIGKFDEEWQVIPFGSNYVGGQVLLAAYLVMLIVVITAAVALAASTRFGQLATLFICTAFVALGVISDYAFGQHEESSLWAQAAYRSVPNIGPFWVIDGLHSNTEKTAVTLDYISYASAYALLVTSSILAIGVAAFQRREVG
jgi:hypothetical protein